MAITKQQLKIIQKALQNHSRQVSLNKTWQKIHNEYGVGEAIGKQLTLSTTDHEKLTDFLKIELGYDPVNSAIKGNRLETATIVNNEKMATETVFSNMMHVHVKQGFVPLKQGNAITPPDTLLHITANDLDLEQINKIILVENGIIARHWHKCCIPEELSDALVIYRGHNQDSQTVEQWLKKLPPRIQKIGYFDFDPAGIAMAVDYPMDAILIPNPINEDLLSHSKTDSFIEQFHHRPELGKQLPEALQTIWQWMIHAERKCAVTQEHLTTLDWQLQVLDLR